MKMRENSIRLKDFDYTLPAGYFLTFNTWKWERLFGEIINGEMRLSPAGELVADTWHWLARQYHYVRLDAWVLMPDHFHGILVIDHRHPNAKPVHQLVGAFKTVSAKRVNDLRENPGMPLWHRSYHDVVIRNDGSIDRIRRYILENPSKWALHHP